MTDFSKYVHAMGRGPSKGRNLNQEEARDAMHQILAGSVAPEAVGALFMLMRYVGETPQEVAGFIQAMRADLMDWETLNVAVDWPSYAAGRTRGLPWFILSALLVAQAGHPVLMHGWNSHQKSVAAVQSSIQSMGLPVCETPMQAQVELESRGFAYAPLSAMHPNALRLLKLRDVLGLRSPVNTVCRGLNPSGADLSVLGVFHPSYRALQVDANALLGQNNMAVIKGGGGEFECNPSKDIEVFSLQNGHTDRYSITAHSDRGKRLSDATEESDDLSKLWSGENQNVFALDIVLNTCAVALQSLKGIDDINSARGLATELWHARAKTFAQGKAL